MAETLKAVANEVSKTLSSINEVAKKVEQLESEIKGYFDKGQLKTWLTNMNSRIQLIQQYTATEEQFRKKIALVRNANDELLVAVNQVKGWGGFSALMHAAPGIATWTQTYALSL